MQPTKIDAYNEWSGGISDYDKGAQQNQYLFGRSVNHRTNPHRLTLLSKTTKESGNIVTDLPVDGDRVGTDLFYYGDTGNIYKRTSAGSHTLIRSVANSHGNGMKYYTEDDFLYYSSDTKLGRYGQIGGNPLFVDDFLGAEGGVPLNTHWLDLESGSSQYAFRADTASLSITSDLAIECTIKPESLPTSGNSMVLFSKWDLNGNIRSYKFEIYALSGYFGDGSDGAVTINTDQTYDSAGTPALIDSACTGTIDTTSLSATNVGFAANQIILIHQSQGTGAGTWQRNKIVSYTAGTITLDKTLNATYGTGAQVIVLKQFTNVAVSSTKTWTAKAWNGTTGGILAFLANGTITITGTITATGKGFRGGTNTDTTMPNQGQAGEGTAGVAVAQTTPNGNGGGGGLRTSGTSKSEYGSGAGGGNSNSGENGECKGAGGGIGGFGGNMAGTADLTTFVFGGGGGSAASYASEGPTGGNGGGAIFITGMTITITGSIISGGNDGGDTSAPSGGGGGAGGSILIKAQVATLGSALVTAPKGSGSLAGGGTANAGGDGSIGRIHLDYYTSYTGTTSPTLDVTQDNSLVTNTTYQLRLGLSSNGTAEEYLAKSATISIGTKYHVGVSWDASASTAEFFQDGISLGSSVGTVTSLNNNASTPAIGCDFNTTARNFYDGKIDEVRIYNSVRTADQMRANKETQIAVNTIGLVAYYQLNNTYDDATANANHLTASGSPVFATDVPFSSPTTRVDIDQSLDTSGNTTALAVAISETATGRQTFVPSKDPQKSIEVNISDIGDDSDWTITVHDALNRVVATATITHANLHTGDFEFTFSSVWRPVVGASYHFHLTATTTTGAPAIVSTSNNDLETADFHTYYQFLIEDEFHPIEQMLNFLVVGNERYVAKYDAAGGYEPHKLTLPSGWRVRCFAKWKNYIAIGCTKGTNIYDTDEGIIFLWDGSSTTYNDYIVIPEGGINALFSTRGTLFIFAGYHGDLLEYTGGNRAEVVKRIPKIEEYEYIETMRKAITMWGACLGWGIAGTSNSSVVERGVYTWEASRGSGESALSYDYPISTGSRATTNVKIGFLYAIDRKLLIGFKDNVSYGMDVVDLTANPFSSGTVEQPIRDYGRVSKEKKALCVRADFEPLKTGESIRVKYKLDRTSNWTESAIVSTAGENKARLQINLGNSKEAQIACDLYTTTTTSPALLELGLEVDPKKTETAY